MGERPGGEGHGRLEDFAVVEVDKFLAQDVGRQESRRGNQRGTYGLSPIIIAAAVPKVLRGSQYCYEVHKVQPRTTIYLHALLYITTP